ncbi:hypothetical protein D3C75_1069300 [compost metagenome]
MASRDMATFSGSDKAWPDAEPGAEPHIFSSKSTLPRMVVNGVRNSWDASETKRRCARSDSSSSLYAP